MQYQPGFQGVKAVDMSFKSHPGKFTDTNHLYQLTLDEPTEYDRKIIDIYTQSFLKPTNDFINMINKSDPWMIDGETFTWDLNVPFEPTVLIEIPAQTATDISALGADGKVFTLVFSRPFQLNNVIMSNVMHGDAFLVVSEARPYNSGFAVDLQLTGATVTKTTVAQSRWIVEGQEFTCTDHITGEFDEELAGIDIQGRKIKMVDTFAAGYGVEHTVTKWADQRTIRDDKGNIKDIIAYTQYTLDDQLKPRIIGQRWESYADKKSRDKMLELRMHRALWGKGGQSQTRGNRNEVRKHIEGIYPKMRRFGQYNDFNKGQFSAHLLRQQIGDLFYGRVEMADRRVKLYTNESGLSLFNEVMLEDMKQAGFTLVADNRFIKGTGQHMMANYAFDMMFSMETGVVEVSHLKDLDLRYGFAQTAVSRKTPPIFFIFDITNPDGGMQNNIREIRQKGNPSMTYGYIPGRQSPFGNMQGGMSASKKPGYTMWFEDRFDIFIEDLSKVVVFEQVPQI